MKKKHIGQIDEVKIYEVDGEHVRNHRNIEFTNYGQHYRFPFIPVNEVWLDREYKPDERSVFIAQACRERELMKNGESYSNAYSKASSEASGLRHLGGKNVKIQLVSEEDGLKTYIVDGKKVRDSYDIGFTQGGHGYVYAYIPKNEIWIDNDLKPSERSPVELHEKYERELMKDHRMNYTNAHRKASSKEKVFRKKNLKPGLVL